MAEDKEFKLFDTKITNILSSSSGASSWSDLLSFTQNIYNILADKKNFEFNFNLLTDKVDLSKRLAQCLNPECPAQVHEYVINVYDVIFKNILKKNNGKLGENLSIFSSGLFPFFNYATKDNKIHFINKVVLNHYLELDPNELALCLSGLLSCLLPGFDDNNEELTNKINNTLDKIKKKMEKKPGVFYGTFWSILLRNKLLRINSFNYLNSDRIITFEKYKELKGKEREEILKDEFPNVNTLIINCLAESIKEGDKVVIRNTMDFIITRLPLGIENKIISDESKITLLQSALRKLISDNQIATRLGKWIQGDDQQEEKEEKEEKEEEEEEKEEISGEMIYKMGLIVSAFKKIFNSKEAKNYEKLRNCNLIVEQFLAQQVNFVGYLLPKISYDLILIFEEFWETELNSSENAINNELIKKLRHTFYNNDNYIYLWESILNYLASVQKKDNLDYESTKPQDVENIEKIILNIVQPLKFCFLFLNVKKEEEKIKYFIPIIDNLIKIMIKLSIKSKEELFKIRHIITTILTFTKGLQEKSSKDDVEEQKEISIKESKRNEIQKNYQLFDISNYVDENELLTDFSRQCFNVNEEMNFQNILHNKSNEKMMNAFHETIISYKNFYADLLKIFDTFTENKIAKMEISYFSKTTEIMIRLQEYIKSEKIPEWINYFIGIIFKKEKNLRLSLEASKYVLDFNISYFKENKIYERIKNEFLNSELDKVLINKDEYDQFNKLGIKTTYYELLFGKYYLQVNEQLNQELIIDVLLKLYKLDSKKFTNIIIQSFKIKENLENNVKLFSDFWQYCNEYHNDLLIFPEGECIFQMLDFLDSENPLLRYSSKSWLDQSSKCYRKIIIPLLNNFLNENFDLNKLENIYEFNNKNTASKVLKFFIRLKNLIANTDIMNFLLRNVPDDKLQKKFKDKNLFLLFEKENKNFELNYFLIITSITLFFTAILFTSKEDEEFKNITLSINTSCCELLQILFSRCKEEEMIMPYIEEINSSLLTLLNIELDKKENYFFQVQLLSVLKSLYNKAKNVPIESLGDIITIFKSKSFQNCLLKGMGDDFIFLKESYINFTRECLPLFKIMMNNESGKNLLYDFGKSLIMCLALKLANKIIIDQKGRKDPERFSHFDIKGDVNNFVFKNYLDEYKEYKLFDDSDVLLELKGIKDITFHILNITPGKSNSIKWKEFKNDLYQNYKKETGFTSFFKSSNSEKSKSFLDGEDEKLFNDLILKLTDCLLLSWINISNKYEPFDFCLNYNGILSLKIYFKEIFSENDVKKGLDSIKKDPIHNIIREICLNLFLVSPINFIENLIKIWCNDFQEKLDPKDEIKIVKDRQYKLTIIELLISLNIPLNIILCCLDIIFIKNSEKNKKVYIREGIDYSIMPYKHGLYEAKVIHFIYSYILLNPVKEIDNIIDENGLIRNGAHETWFEMANFLTTLVKDTKIIYTHCWIYELLGMVTYKLEIPDKIDSSVRSKLIDLFLIVTQKLENCGFYNITECKIIKDDKLILPCLPSIYFNVIKEIYPEYISYLYSKNESMPSQNIKINQNINPFNPINDSKSTIGELGSFYSLYSSLCRIFSETMGTSSKASIKKMDLENIYCKLACISLMNNFYTIAVNLYEYKPDFKAKLSDIIKKLFDLLKNNNSKLSNIQHNFYPEYASKFLANLIEEGTDLVAESGKYMFLDYLNDDNFFRTTHKILINFKVFISKLVKYFPQILSKLFQNIESKLLFIDLSTEAKVKTLRRISFVIYSCEKDEFKNDFENIRDKAKIILSSVKRDIQLEREIFLLMRILFLRFCHDGVMKMIKELWPIIFAEIIKNLNNKNLKIEDKKKEKNSINLVIENFKFIELLSLANPEEFCLYQWIFLVDTFSMKDLDIQDKKSLLYELLKKECTIFKPVALNFLDQKSLETDKDVLEGKHKGKSELIFCPEKATLEDLQKSLKKLFYSIGDMNNYKIELDSEQVEKLIEEDFLISGNEINSSNEK